MKLQAGARLLAKLNTEVLVHSIKGKASLDPA